MFKVNSTNTKNGKGKKSTRKLLQCETKGVGWNINIRNNEKERKTREERDDSLRGLVKSNETALCLFVKFNTVFFFDTFFFKKEASLFSKKKMA